MDKKAMMRVFGGAFLRSLIVLVAIAILGFGVFFIIKVNTDKKDVADNTEAATSEYTPDELAAMVAEDNAVNAEGATEAATEAVTEATTEEVTTEEPTTEIPDIPSTDKNIIVLNSTSTSGLAGAWSNKLKGAGFANIAVGNYSAGNEATTKIYVAEEGMGKDLLSYFSGATIVVGNVDAGVYSVTGGSMDHYDIFIVIGNSDTTVK
ncbi:MAG: LytR C-terminal domain-containing protein [Lachnospiraceae bacterium]